MIFSPRALASILLGVLVLPAARARADAEIGTSDAPETQRAPAPPSVAAAPHPVALAKIEWRDVFWGDRYGRVLHAEVPYQSGRLLEGEGLYLALGRSDLAEAYRKRQEIKTGLGVAAGIFLASAVISGAIAAEQWSGDRAPAAPVIGMASGIILSCVFGIAGAVYPAAPLREDELHGLVDAHNRMP